MQASLGIMKYLLPTMGKDGRIAIVVVDETQKRISALHTDIFCLEPF